MVHIYHFRLLMTFLFQLSYLLPQMTLLLLQVSDLKEFDLQAFLLLLQSLYLVFLPLYDYIPRLSITFQRIEFFFKINNLFFKFDIFLLELLEGMAEVDLGRTEF